MVSIIELLKEKNFYLERFLEESRKERASFKARRFDNLEPLYKKREQILQNIQSIDARINKMCADKSEEILNMPNKGEMQTLLKTIKDNVRYIMEEDIEIISCIENEKTKIIKEISQTKEGRRVLNGSKAL